MDVQRPLNYARAHRAKFVSELKDFIRFPSVSSKADRRDDIRRCAHWLARNLQQIGLERVRVIQTAANPIVYASWQRATGRPSLIIYGHYDVVAAEPLREWRTPPFTASVEDNKLFGRGAADDKGQLFSHLKALQSYLSTNLALPVNVKCIFEGDEEVGSPHLRSFIAHNRQALRAHAAVISDTRMLAPNRPAISYAQRGGLHAELEITGPAQELHAGAFGGAVHNPVLALCEIIAGLHDDQGRITIPGFYDDVRVWDDKERAFMSRSGPSDGEILRDATVAHGWGEVGYSLYERTTIRPDLGVHAILGGHIGPGIKSIIPTRALAKLSFRLVPDQDPQLIAKILRDHIAHLTPKTVSSTLRITSPVQPALVNRNHPAVRAAALAYKKGFGALPVFVRSGGSIPVVNMFQKILGIPAVLMGFGLPDDHIHGPNEKLYLPNFYKAIETSIWYLALASRLRGLRMSQQKEWSA